MANYSLGRKPLPTVENGHEFFADNFLQLVPTEIFVGVTGLKFRNCNLTNCILPEDADTEGCAVRKVEFCSNFYPEWVAHGLAECVENCDHVVDVAIITIDGVEVSRTYEYENKEIA